MYIHAVRTETLTHTQMAGEPITTEAIRYGMRVGVIVLPAHPMLRTPQAMKVVGPKAFGFDIPYVEPHSLQV